MLKAPRRIDSKVHRWSAIQFKQDQRKLYRFKQELCWSWRTPTRLMVRFLRIFQEIGWQKIGRESVALVNYVVTFITVIIIAMWLHSLQEAKHEIPLTLACVRAGKSLEQGKDLTPLDEQRPPQLTSFCKVSIQSHTSHEIFTSPSLIQIILAVPVLHGEYFNKCTCK